MLSYFSHAEGATIHSLATARASKEILVIVAFPDFQGFKENQHRQDLMAQLDQRDSEESEEKKELWVTKDNE